MTRHNSTREPDAPDTPDTADGPVILPGETAEAAIARLVAANAALMAELESAKRARSARTGPTPKQRKMLEVMAANPNLGIPDLCVLAGATATSHGFVFRMIEDGLLDVTISDRGRTYVTGDAPTEGSPATDA